MVALAGRISRFAGVSGDYGGVSEATAKAARAAEYEAATAADRAAQEAVETKEPAHGSARVKTLQRSSARKLSISGSAAASAGGELGSGQGPSLVLLPALKLSEYHQQQQQSQQQYREQEQPYQQPLPSAAPLAAGDGGSTLTRRTSAEGGLAPMGSLGALGSPSFAAALVLQRMRHSQQDQHPEGLAPPESQLYTAAEEGGGIGLGQQRGGGEGRGGWLSGSRGAAGGVGGGGSSSSSYYQRQQRLAGQLQLPPGKVPLVQYPPRSLPSDWPETSHNPNQQQQQREWQPRGYGGDIGPGDPLGGEREILGSRFAGGLGRPPLPRGGGVALPHNLGLGFRGGALYPPRTMPAGVGSGGSSSGTLAVGPGYNVPVPQKRFPAADARRDYASAPFAAAALGVADQQLGEGEGMDTLSGQTGLQLGASAATAAAAGSGGVHGSGGGARLQGPSELHTMLDAELGPVGGMPWSGGWQQEEADWFGPGSAAAAGARDDFGGMINCHGGEEGRLAVGSRGKNGVTSAGMAGSSGMARGSAYSSRGQQQPDPTLPKPFLPLVSSSWTAAGGWGGAAAAAGGGGGGGAGMLVVSGPGMQSQVISPFAQYQGGDGEEEATVPHPGLHTRQQQQEQQLPGNELLGRAAFSWGEEQPRERDTAGFGAGRGKERGGWLVGHGGAGDMPQDGGAKAAGFDGTDAGAAAAAAHPVMVVPRVRARKKVAGQVDLH